MQTNTSSLKTFAQQTRAKLISLITAKMQFVLYADTAELRGCKQQISALRSQIAGRSEKNVIEEIAYTWFNRVVALRFMDANGYNAPMVVTPAEGQTRPEILQDAMGGSIDDALMLTADEKMLPEAKLYRRLLVAVCNRQMSTPMPFLFERISGYTELLLPDDLLSDQSFITDIRRGMTDEDCRNVEIMGWLYQFYITDRKADAEAKKSKKGGLKSDEQAAATQLFTPHWIVRYMVENSLGRIWMTLHPESHLVDDMPYYIATPEGQTDTIPDDIHSAQDIRFLDPCMGSGHILVYAFDLFCKMYEEEGHQQKDIPALILRNNLYGIDIDRRCYQLSGFALTMKARAYYRRYLRHIVIPNVIALENIDHEAIASTGTWPEESLIWQFEHIDTIGSLLKVTPEECAAIRVDESSLFGFRQKLMKTQAEYLSGKYHCVVTNPPYLGKGFGDELKNYLTTVYPDSKYDIMATFMERCYEYCLDYGKYSMINMHSWMFLTSFNRLRSNIVKTQLINSLLHLGPHTFDELSGEVVQNVAFVISKCVVNGKSGIYFRLIDGKNCKSKEHSFLDANKNHNAGIYYGDVRQMNFPKIPNMPIGYWLSEKYFSIFSSCKKLSNLVETKLGMSTNDNGRFLRQWYEVSLNKSCFTRKNTDSARFIQKWFPYSKGGGVKKWFGGVTEVINWEDNGQEVKQLASDLYGSYTRTCKNSQHFFREAITWNLISSGGKNSFRYLPEGSILGDAGPVCFTGDKHLYYLGLLNTKFVADVLALINPTINCSTGVVNTIPVIERIDGKIEHKVKDAVNISKLDWDSHETSWDFRRSPLWEQQLYTILFEMQECGILSPDSTIDDIGPFNLPDLMQPIEILVENYKSEWEDLFDELHSNEEELNRQFIEIYGLQDDLTPDVPLEEVTILQKGEISIEDNKIIWHDDVIIKQFISWIVGCLMGRWSADKPGLIIASQGQRPADIDLPMQTVGMDDDGIIPVIMEPDFFPDDLAQRVEKAVRTLLGDLNFAENMKYIRQCLGQELRDYLYRNFYADHQQMYSVKGARRPIYWLFSSQMGDRRKKGYFKALVYMHRMEADTLSKLHADYVHPYVQKIEQQLMEAEEDAVRDDLSGTQHNKALKAAEELREKVREVKTFETALVEMASARLRLDLDDGVKANYPKFYPLVEPIKGLDKVEE